MFVALPLHVEVQLNSAGGSLRFVSTDEKAITDFVMSYAMRQGMLNVGAVRVTTCDITGKPGNYEPDLGVPSPHHMILVSHQELEFAGTREPLTFTVFRTLKMRPDQFDDLEPYYEYHLNAALA